MKEHPASKWLSAHYNEVAKKYPFEWVVADANGVIAHDKDISKIAHHDSEKVALVYMDMQGFEP